MAVTLTAQTFGGLLKYLRRRARLTQRELALRVGYTEAHLCRLEKDERQPDISTVATLFVPALELEESPAQVEQLLKLASQSRLTRQGGRVTVRRTGVRQVEIRHEVVEDLGALEDVPPAPTHWVARPELIRRAAALLQSERRLALIGMAGAGKTMLAAELARTLPKLPVFWTTLTTGVSDTAPAIIRALALFYLTQGQTQVRPILEHDGASPPLPLDQQLNLLRSAVTAAPAVLCLDDVHLALADPAGRALFEGLAATTMATLVLTSRERLPFAVPQLTVPGLAPDQIRSLIANFGADPEADWATALADRTGGNPMLLRLALGQIGDPALDAPRFVARLASQPQVAAFLINDVLRRLAQDALWLIELVAIFRHPLDLYDGALAELVAQARPEIALGVCIQVLQAQALIDDARQAGLHPLVREHLLAQVDTDPVRKRRLHRLAADWTRHRSDDVLELVYHCDRAGDTSRVAEAIRGQEEAVAARGQAAAAAEILARTLRVLERGRKSDRNNRLRRELHTSRGVLLVGSLQAREAEAEFRRALDLTADAHVRADLVAWIVPSMLERNAYAESLALISEARSWLGSNDTFLAAQLAAAEAWAFYDLSRIDEAALAGESALRMLAAFGQASWQRLQATRVMAHGAMASVSRARLDVAAALRHAQAAVDAADRGGLRRLAVSKLGFLGGLRFDQGALTEADRIRSATARAAEELGDSYTVAYLTMYLSDHDRIWLSIDRGLARLDVAERLMAHIEDRHGQADQQARRAVFRLWRGDVQAALDLLEGPAVGASDDVSSRSHGYNLNRLAQARLVADPSAWARAKDALDQALALPGTRNDHLLRFNLATTAAALWITAGEAGRAVTCLEREAPRAGFPLWGRLERSLIESIATWASGDRATSARQLIGLQAVTGDYPLYATRIARLLAEPDHHPLRIPRLLWCGSDASA